ncbi:MULTISPECIES: TetR/AcrR family transcriptional regulator [Gordonia]|uniref:Helix-turn-helix domain-containing protein n=1 Tax=Gordonia amicalis TaxID=89053 RepID=A0AAE4UB58_9ACTN|nr:MULTISPECIES: helix-turn-helix domain-containing protein [Gordonia]ATD72662.1 TetR/AcrR family transcriptional regulator [Gordonia sp. 1D]MCR8898268.1 TetR/AcrR family transcriptional regulator [Gordonia sp. GONU]MCZ4578359.1 helix-turn-helix domain containing protein [Gordonia amicalis]MCZ4650919.1 helix-turn-helix domain containing protein [Gordonia amicalis]MDJ0452995.1 helix-turn-helix domain-containing protein [Gordonia amicalis]
MTDSASRRLSAGDYFDEAMRVLEDSGFPALTAAGLCERLGATRGSFYHHFKNFDDFVAKFLDYWEERYSRDLIARPEAPDLWSQIDEQANLAIGLPHAAEAALRAWATVEPRVATAQRRVDELRRQGLAASLQRHGIPETQAAAFAAIAIAALAGIQVTRQPLDQSEMRAMYSELARALRQGGPS